MWPAQAVLLSLACVALSGSAASMKSNSESSSSSSGPAKVQTTEIVQSLTEVSKGLGKEDDKALSAMRQHAKECKKDRQDLDLALKKSKRKIEIATQDYEKVSAQVDALQAEQKGLKQQIQDSNNELDTLQAKLKKMRTDKGVLKSSASAALQQMEVVLERITFEEHQPHHHKVAALKHQVSDLERLSQSLSFVQTASHKKPSSALILKNEKMDVVEASITAQKGFNEEEKRVIELIDLERRKLRDLEDNLADLQPSISNKLQQAMEINRTLDAGERAQHRDTDLSEVSKAQCHLVSNGLAAQRDARRKVTNDVDMASKLIANMDTSLFLAQDLQDLGKRPDSLLQLRARRSHGSGSHGSGSRSSFIDVTPFTPGSLSLSQDTVSSDATEDDALESMSAVYGPFDKVAEMISGLIASLKAQANEEVNQHQFCQDSLGENRRHRVSKKLSIDTLASNMQWDKMALVRLDDDLEYCGEEIERMTAFRAEQKKAHEAEEKRNHEEHKEHELAHDVVNKAVVILVQLCDLGNAGASFAQHNGKKLLRHGSRFDQCAEAANLLKSGISNLEHLDHITDQYFDQYTGLADHIDDHAKDYKEDRVQQETAVKAAKAQRASELATAEKDMRDATQDLKLIDDAEKELEHSCSHIETREEKMARRKEEIQALKQALKVLEGEAIPVD